MHFPFGSIRSVPWLGDVQVQVLSYEKDAGIKILPTQTFQALLGSSAP